MAGIHEWIDAMILPGWSNWAPTVACYEWILKSLGMIGSDRVFEPLEPLTPEEERHLAKRALPLEREFCGGSI